jgi:ribosomal protein RSM22 (predicted rRNA methylase)
VFETASSIRVEKKMFRVPKLLERAVEVACGDFRASTLRDVIPRMVTAQVHRQAELSRALQITGTAAEAASLSSSSEKSVDVADKVNAERADNLLSMAELYTRVGKREGSRLYAQAWQNAPTTREGAAAYTCYRGPGVYCGTLRAFNDASERLARRGGGALMPKRFVHSVLDFGSGSAMAPWALLRFLDPDVEDWTPLDDDDDDGAQRREGAFVRKSGGAAATRIQTVVAVEPSTPMRAIGSAVMRPALESGAIGSVRYKRYLDEDSTQHDVVIAAHTLGVLESDTVRSQTVRALWKRTQPGGLLVVVERGSTSGFEIVAAARQEVLASNKGHAVVLAPCPHSQPRCALADTEAFCHFGQRVQRTKLMSSTLVTRPRDNYYTERLSYVVLRKSEAVSHEEDRRQRDAGASSPVVLSRVINSPRKRSGHVIFTTCTATSDLGSFTVSKSTAGSSSRFKTARKAKWGDLLEFCVRERRPHRRRSAFARANDDDDDDDDDSPVLGAHCNRNKELIVADLSARPKKQTLPKKEKRERQRKSKEEES